MTKKKTPYRMMKLRSGDEVIARIVGQTKKKLILERPMQVKVGSVLESGMRKDVVLLRNWLQFSEGDRAEIPLDWVAMFMKPDEDIVYMYDNEKRKEDEFRKHLDEVENDEEAAKGVLENFLKMIKASKEQKAKEELEEKANKFDPKNFIEPGSVMMNIAIPPEIFMEIISNGMLDNFDLGAMMGGEVEEEEDEDEYVDEGLSDKHTPNGDGTNWTDWSPNVKDYLNEDSDDKE